MNSELRTMALSLEQAIKNERPEELTERIEDAVAYKEMWMDPTLLKFAQEIRSQRFTIEESDIYLEGNNVFVEHSINAGQGREFRLWVQGTIGRGLSIAMLKSEKRGQPFAEQEYNSHKLDRKVSQQRFRLALLQFASEMLPEPLR